MHTGCRFAGIASAIVFTVGSVAAQLTPQGSEFQVNTYTTNTQLRSASCHDADGDFVVAWDSYKVDGNGYGIAAQRFASNGSPVGTEFVVNTYTMDGQEHPALCCKPDGAFVIAWDSDGNDGDLDGVFGQRYDSSGAPDGTEFQINTSTTRIQKNPTVCCDSGGDFVVAWQSDHSDDQYDIFGQRYDSAGGAQGSEFRVNSYTMSTQTDPAICCDAGGNFVVTWTDDTRDGSGYSVQARRFDSGGAPQASQFQVNTYTTNDQYNAGVCCGEAGRFVVTWASYAQDGDGGGIFGQRFDPAGAAVGTEFPVPEMTAGDQQSPAICCDRSGNFIVAWESGVQDGDGSGLFARGFDTSGGAISSDLQVNTYTTGNQRFPATSSNATGEVVVTWASANQDGDDDGIFAQRLLLLVSKGRRAAPMLSVVGLGGLAATLLGLGVRAVRKRRKPSSGSR